MEMHYPSLNQLSVTKAQHIASIILYIVLSFILSLIFFVIVVVGLSLGFGTLVLFIGLPILLITFSAIGGIAAIERSIASSLLGVEIPAPRARYTASMSWWRRSLANLRDPLTWKSLLYVLFKFPFSVFSFSVMVSLVATSISLILAPVGYLVATSVLMLNGIHVHSDPSMFLGLHAGISSLFDVAVTGTFDPAMFFKSFAWTLVGIAFGLLSCYLLRGLGWLSAEFARVMLSPVSGAIAGAASEVQYTYRHRDE